MGRLVSRKDTKCKSGKCRFYMKGGGGGVESVGIRYLSLQKLLHEISD